VEWVLSELERLVSASRAWTRNIVSLMGVEEGEEDEEEEEREEPGEEGGKRRAKRKARRKALVVMKEMLEEGIVKAVEMEEEAQVGQIGRWKGVISRKGGMEGGREGGE